MRQHGSFTMAWNGPILVVTYKDVWNVEAVVALHAAARAAWLANPLPQWAMLTNASDWEGGTPEMLERWWTFFGDAVQNGLSTVTDLLPTSFHALIVKGLAERAASMVQYQRSNDLSEAYRWLESRGFSAATIP